MQDQSFASHIFLVDIQFTNFKCVFLPQMDYTIYTHFLGITDNIYEF